MSTDLAAENLKSLKKPELADLCKARNLKVSGTKEELIQRLLGGSVTVTASTQSASAPKAATKPLTKPLTKALSKAATEVRSEEVVKRLAQVKLPIIQLRRNKFGNCIHMDTQLVFNIETRRAYGKQKVDGIVEPLTDEDIETCKMYKFAYVIPTNLDRNKSDLKSVAVEELNEEDMEEDELAEDDENDDDDDDDDEEFEEEPEEVDEIDEFDTTFE